MMSDFNFWLLKKPIWPSILVSANQVLSGQARVYARQDIGVKDVISTIINHYFIHAIVVRVHAPVILVAVAWIGVNLVIGVTRESWHVVAGGGSCPHCRRRRRRVRE